MVRYSVIEGRGVSEGIFMIVRIILLGREYIHSMRGARLCG